MSVRCSSARFDDLKSASEEGARFRQENLWSLTARPFRKRNCFVRSRGMLGRTMTAVIELALIAILVAIFIVAAIFALDLSDVW